MSGIAQRILIRGGVDDLPWHPLALWGAQGVTGKRKLSNLPNRADCLSKMAIILFLNMLIEAR